MSEVELITLILDEAPIGAIDGSNKVFTFSAALIPGTDDVFKNGQKLYNGIGYTITGTTLTFVDAPQSYSDGTSDQLWIHGFKA